MLSNAGLLRRAGAMVYDSLIVMAIAMAYGAVVLAFKVAVAGETLAEGEKAQLGPLGFVGLLAVITLFFCHFWRRGGQTIGMRAWRLRIISEDGSPPSWPQCLLRCALAPMALAAVGLGYLWSLVDKQGCTLHDKFSHSRIVVLPKEKKKL